MKKEEKATEFFEAPYVVHWPTGPVECCEKHMKGLVAISSHLGSHVGVTVNTNPIDKQCESCVSKNKDK